VLAGRQTKAKGIVYVDNWAVFERSPGRSQGWVLSEEFAARVGAEEFARGLAIAGSDALLAASHPSLPGIWSPLATYASGLPHVPTHPETGPVA